MFFLKAFTPYVVILVLGSFHSSSMAAEGAMDQQEDLRAALTVNQVAILEILQLIRRDYVPNYCTERAQKEVQLEAKLQEMSSTISRIDEDHRGVLQQLATLQAEVQELQAVRTGCLLNNGTLLPDGHIVRHGCESRKCNNGSLLVMNRQESGVPDGFHTVSDGCYLPVAAPERTWLDSRNYCILLGADLAKPPSDMRAFTEFLMDSYPRDFSWWLGGKVDAHGIFSYVSDGTPIQHKHWPQGEPKHGANCLYTNADRNPPLYSYDCSDGDKFVCQYN